jgi:iron(II)-dependent oxidoreductase
VHWCRYFPPATMLNQHGKFLLMDDAYERSATIGFRCVQDA